MYENEMNSSPMVSVIVPAYNHERYIEKCLISIFSQTYTNMEVIVINDGSKDNTLKVLHETRKTYPFILIDQKNIGLANSLNKGIREAKGKYISFVASDDYWSQNKVDLQVTYLENNKEFGMCCGKAYEVNDQGIKLGVVGEIGRAADLEFSSLIKGNRISALTVMVKKEVLDNVGGFDPNLYIEDWDMWLRVADQYKIGYLDSFLAFYRRHSTNISNRINAMELSKLQIVEKWRSYPDFNLIHQRQILNSFNELAGKDKRAALSFLKIVYPYWNNMRFYRGLFKIIAKW